VWPSWAGAQQRTASPVVGYLSGGSPGFSAPYVAAFYEGLSEAGYIEGRNLRIEYRWAEGQYDRLPALAAELVDRKVDLIVASGGDVAALAAKTATSSIPVVFAASGDPVIDGLVASLNRPGGNLTGINFFAVELSPKRLELICELVAQASVIGLLVNPRNSNSRRVVEEVTGAAYAKGVKLEVVNAGSDGEIDTAFDSLARSRVKAVIVDPDHFIDSRREKLVTLAARHAMPAIYGLRELAAGGGLMSYGVSLAAVYRQLGAYAGRVLKGADPADLPVQRPTKFEMVINMRTANALGLTVRPTLLARADEVIE
jgi:putative ABC transport system substrate-binding protein